MLYVRFHCFELVPSVLKLDGLVGMDGAPDAYITIDS